MNTRRKIILSWFCLAIYPTLWLMQPTHLVAWPLIALGALLTAILLRRSLGDPLKRAPRFIRILTHAAAFTFVGLLFSILLDTIADGLTWLTPVMVVILYIIATPCFVWAIYDDYRLYKRNTPIRVQ